MIKLFVVDDETAAIDNLGLLLEGYKDEFSIVGSAVCVIDAVKQLQHTDVDVVFLDISLPDGSGFDVLELLGEIPFKVIFFTAYEQYAIKAIKQCAFDYLLKPVLTAELDKTLQNVKDALKREGNKASYRKLAVSTSSGLDLIEESEILYCKADNNYAHIFMQSGEEIVISKPLKSLEKVLTKERFIRPHQSFLLNRKGIKKYIKMDSVLLLVNDMEIPVSKSNREYVLMELGKFAI